MKKFLATYKSSLILLCSIILGAIIGLIFKEKASILTPFGDLFINALLVIIVPLIFFTITSSIGKMNTPKRIGKILVTVIAVFAITSLFSLLISLAIAKNIKLVDIKNADLVKETLKSEEIVSETEKVDFLKRTVDTVSVNAFSKIITNDNLIALIVFSILIGVSVNISKEKGKDFLKLLDSGNEVIQKYIKIIMYYAPIGLGCYFASLVGSFGSSLTVGYVKTLIIYIIISLFIYFIMYSLYALIAGGKKGFVLYWKNIIPPTLTALATCSSAASIPVNVTSSKNIGVSDDVANTTIPLGTSFHKDGSIVGSVFKIMFLVYLFEANIPIGKILGIALLATLLISAVPIGGGTISETLIITSLGFPLTALPILTVIATIIDPPATALNVVGDSACSMMVSRIVDGKKWLNKKV